MTALARGLSILNAFQPDELELGNQEIAKRVGLAKPTVSRLTYTLTRLGYLQYSAEAGKYRIGMAALALGYRSMSNMYIRRIAKPLLERAARELEMCAALGYRDELSAVYLEYARGPALLPYALEPGSRIPLATTALGRSLIVDLPPHEMESLMKELRRAVHRDSWAHVRTGIEQAAADYRHFGVIISLGDWEPQVHSVGMPLLLNDGHPGVAIMFGGGAREFSRRRLLEEVRPYLDRTARRIEELVNLGTGDPGSSRDAGARKAAAR